MIEGLDHLLESRGQPGLAQLRGLLRELLGGHEAEGRLIEEQTLQPRGLRVFRLRFAINGHVRQVIVKRLRPEIALRGALIAERWLPAVGMRDSGPALLGSVAEPGGNCGQPAFGYQCTAQSDFRPQPLHDYLTNVAIDGEAQPEDAQAARL